MTAFDLAVVIPCYNAAETIAETLRSVLAQTRSPRQLVVVDDGSTDETVAIVRAVAPLATVVRQPNAGPGHARHAGVSATDAAFVAFLDGDDVWAPTFVADVERAVAEHADAAYVFSNFRPFTSSGPSERTKFDDAPAGFWPPGAEPQRGFRRIDAPLYAQLLQFQPIFPSALVVRRAYYDSIGGFPSRFSREPSEDFEFMLRCGSGGPAVAIEAPLLAYRSSPSSFSGRGDGFVAGDVRILEYSLTTHPFGRANADRIREEIIRRSKDVVDRAYHRRDRALLNEFMRKIPMTERSLRLWAKWLLGQLRPSSARR